MVSRSERAAKRCGNQESIAMLDMTRGPSTKPVWAATSNSAFIPTMSDRFSSRPPTTAPNMFAPSAAAGESAARNSEANNSPTKKMGTAKTAAAISPTDEAGSGMRLKGKKNAKAMARRRRASIQDRGQGFCRFSVT